MRIKNFNYNNLIEANKIIITIENDISREGDALKLK